MLLTWAAVSLMDLVTSFPSFPSLVDNGFLSSAYFHPAPPPNTARRNQIYALVVAAERTLFPCEARSLDSPFE